MADPNLPAQPASQELEPVLEGQIDRNAKGRFIKGSRAGKGRPKGSQNKVSRTVKEILAGVAEKLGSDGEGTGGLDGFFENLARVNPEFLGAAIVRGSVAPAKEGDSAAGGGIMEVHVLPVVKGGFIVDGRICNQAVAEADWRNRHPELVPLLEATTEPGAEDEEQEPPQGEEPGGDVVLLHPHRPR